LPTVLQNVESYNKHSTSSTVPISYRPIRTQQHLIIVFNIQSVTVTNVFLSFFVFFFINTRNLFSWLWFLWIFVSFVAYSL